VTRFRAQRRTKLRDQGVEAGGDPDGVGLRRRRYGTLGLSCDSFQRLFQPRGKGGRIFIFSQAPLRRLRCHLRFNQPTG